ncbi:peptidoglycan editing factor PgeF [Nitrosomonas sp. JL21]|uniref:peptidoglycan editing factor PgeF n=1 Tax=Nitrosomonas sp. JL21 TaxID=153949 RepID=UPI00136AACB5|nr:peptidoglycan editing factor PgeF [Nitrosomonas sp. JL21]MBL8498703.1 peptidoglycan editing factor PgeF [Nitrosomonas sp.]MXS77462.1 peptidoglycan editing factor PgeF [Nitrosomonas sp. JL21]
MNHEWIIPDWPAPGNVKSLFTTRIGGVSGSINKTYASFNVAMHVNDDCQDVERNRALLRRYLPAAPQWLKQVHGTHPVAVDAPHATIPEGDAAFSGRSGSVCVIMVADCLPVFLCDTSGTAVGVAHAGWRGLAGGVIERLIAAMEKKPDELMAWLGPAIGPKYFEVGVDVHNAFVGQDAQAEQAFIAIGNSGQQKWLADIFLLARQRLVKQGVTRIYGGDVCTFSDSERFFSYRRDGETGRMAALIWLE